MASRSSEVVSSVPMGASVAERAYFKAERRGFAPGYEVEDWLAAEREIAALAAAPKKRAARRKNGTIKKLE